MVYQRLVDGRLPEGGESDGRILQMRAVIVGSRIILTYAKWRPYPKWFSGTEVTLPRPTDELLSAAEQELLLRFAASIGLEYGELDTLRDRESGLIYVVDANRTPVRPKNLAAGCTTTRLGLRPRRSRRRALGAGRDGQERRGKSGSQTHADDVGQAASPSRSCGSLADTYQARDTGAGTGLRGRRLCLPLHRAR